MVVEKHQLDNPNNCRIFIDYRKEKEQVKFDYVVNYSIFSIAQNTYTGLLFKFPLLYIWLGLSGMGLLLEEPMLFLLGGLVYFIFYMILPLLTIKSKRLQRIIPKLNCIGITKYEAIFNPDNIKENQIEIPLFKNIMLDYKATEEMSKYLERVEITEHDFNRIITRKKKERNQYLWKAIFYFSAKPSNGELKVTFN